MPGTPLGRVFLPFSVWWHSACLRFLYFFSLSKLVFSNWSGLDIYSTFHANFCSFLIFHEFESTDISTPQQLPARGRHVYSFLSASSAATQFARLWQVSFGERHHAHICWAEMFDRNQNTNFVWSCQSHTFTHCWDGMSNGSTFVSTHCWANNVCQFDHSLTVKLDTSFNCCPSRSGQNSVIPAVCNVPE